MRRKDREITAIEDLLAIIDKCKVCRLGLCENGQPYVVPLNFGYTYEQGILTLYFHSAHEGRKIDMIKKNNRVCFELDCDHSLLTGGKACEYSFAFSSIIGFGSIEFVNDVQGKIHGLNILMRHQAGKDIRPDYSKEALDAVTVYKLVADEFSGKGKAVIPAD